LTLQDPVLPARPAVRVPVRCPGCDADDAQFRYRLPHSAIVTCRECGLSYVTPRAPSELLEARLQDWARQDVLDDARLRAAFDEGNMAHYRRLLERIERCGPNARRRLLDVGCATGAFLSAARQRGWAVRGVEIGVASVDYARSRLGLDVERGSLYMFDAPNASFDLVAMLEVVEHLEHPADSFRRIHRLLASGGLLLLTTPNFDSLFRRLFGVRWWVVNCEDEHIVLFNRATLARMLECHGYEVVDTQLRGLDPLGMWRAAKDYFAGRRRPDTAGDAAGSGYYDSRSGRARLKSWLNDAGLLAGARGLGRALDATFNWRLSPTYGWGEQLIVVARKP